MITGKNLSIMETAFHKLIKIDFVQKPPPYIWYNPAVWLKTGPSRSFLSI